MIPRSRLVVLGLDGMPLDLALWLSDRCPNLGRIAAQATTVRAELPELSPVNWTSMFTAEGPERHQVYGFTRIDPERYELSVASSESVACPTIFDRLGERDLTSKVINLPNTYPARPLRGMLVAGFVAEELSRAVFPPFLAGPLSQGGYLLEADTTRGASDPDHLLAGLKRTLDSRRLALDLLWPDLEWDLFIFVLTETDRLFHFLLPAVVRNDHPLHAPVMALLLRWDELIGEFLERYDALPGPKRLVVLADHGFTELKTEVDLNAWLRQRGNLILDGTPRDEWDASMISHRSTAFALDPGRIHVHRSGAFARGPLSDADGAALLEELRRELEGLTWSGERVMKRVFAREELYGDAPDGQAPDLICEPQPGFDLKAKFDRTDIFGTYGRFGTHTADGAIFLDSEGSEPERMRDVGRLILEHFHLPDPTP